MTPNPKFTALPKRFWASVRTLSQQVGYTNRGEGSVKVPSLSEMCDAFQNLRLNTQQLRSTDGKETELAQSLDAYFRFRAKVLNEHVKPRLMDLKRVTAEFNRIANARPHKCPMPKNKQKGNKKKVAFLTAIVNMLIEENLGNLPCNHDPRVLTTVTDNGVPIRTLARRVDGAFPSVVNPIAIWEIKEYYHTKTFGSRIADGVYESMLDGMELEELKESEGVSVQHLLVLDDRFTWWDCGRSYLCRVIDMLHMGYVDEVLFGYEVIERLPAIVKSWVRAYRRQLKSQINL
jgi:hypothetical protein